MSPFARLFWITWGVLILLVFAKSLVGSAHADPLQVVASFYGAESGNKTANGERFNPQGMTAAHRTLPFGTRLRVCFRGCAVVRISDRGPFVRGRSLDLSAGAARAIGLTRRGVGKVSMEVVR